MALVAADTPEALRPPMRAAIHKGPSFLSIISFWEVMIKSQKGLLDVGDPRLWWAATRETLVLEPLLFGPEHVSALYDLPFIHHDPFDRALIAQATVEDLAFLTTDTRIAQYAPNRFRILS